VAASGNSREVDTFKSGFFDRGAVLAAVGAAATTGMKRTGGYIRAVARNSMKKAAARVSSAPGTPPNVHIGTLKNLLFFAFDLQTNSLVVGPVGFKGSDTPRTLETGGRGIAKRPYMKPAQEVAVREFASNIRVTNAIRFGSKIG
jgi:hypothetical protein